MQNERQRGTTLIEALVAAMIAALVIAALSQSLSVSAQAQRRVAETRQFTANVANVMALGHARVPIQEIRRDYPDLIIELRPVPMTAPQEFGGWRPMNLRAAHPTNRRLAVETIIMARGAE
ncbi:MAG: type II secretion system protein [Pseudomonadota bacterium]